jgi:hypothetical protein
MMLRDWKTWLALVGLVLVPALPARAQILRLTDDNPAGKIQPAPAANDRGPKEIRFDPAAEVSPAFRYQFWVPRIRREPGNAVAHLLRAYVMYQNANQDKQLSKQFSELDEQLDESPVEKYPTEKMRTILDRYRSVLDELALAERAERIDYDFRINELRGTAIFATLLPEIQQSRDLARLLRMDAQLAIAEGRYDDAIQTLRTGFRLGEIVSAMGNSFLVSKLVAVAIDMIMLEEVESLIQQPGSPNLYWALASLPAEIGEMRNALEGERFAFEGTLYHVMELPDEPISRAAWQDRIVGTIVDFMQLDNNSSFGDAGTDRVIAQLTSGALLLVQGPFAKEALRSQGYSEDALKAMSYSEAAIRVTREHLATIESEFYKWSLVPRTDTDIAEKADVYLKGLASRKAIDPASVVAALLLPAINAAQKAGDRVLTNRNQLITLEAIRAHAAAHNGKLPESLDKLDPLPAWKQAGSGNPFEYQRISDSEAILRRPPHWPGGHDRNAEVRLIVAPSKAKASKSAN